MRNDLFNQALLKKYGENFKLTPTKHDLIKYYISKLDSSVFKSKTKNYLHFMVRDLVLRNKIEGYGAPHDTKIFNVKRNSFNQIRIFSQ